MKRLESFAWGGIYKIIEHDTDTHEKREQEITAEQWEWVQAAAPDLHGIRRRFLELAARYGMRHDPAPPRTKSLWGAWDEKHGDK